MKRPRKPAVQHHQPPVRSKPGKYFFGLCSVIATAISILVMIVKAIETYKPKDVYDWIVCIIIAISIYVYFGLDAKDKMKKWGLID